MVLRYPLAYEHVAEMLGECGLEVDAGWPKRFGSSQSAWRTLQGIENRSLIRIERVR